jgi:GNAT superfamily N-acetyltransferase
MQGLEFLAYDPEFRHACVEVVRSQVGSYLAPGEEDDFEDFLDRLEKVGGNTTFWVVRMNVDVVGCGGLTVEGDCATLCWGILRAGSLSQGIGKALLQHRLGWLKENHPDVKSILCETAPLTEGFFAKHGFKTYLRKPRYWGGELELVAMELSLDGLERGPGVRRRR